MSAKARKKPKHYGGRTHKSRCKFKTYVGQKCPCGSYGKKTIKLRYPLRSMPKVLIRARKWIVKHGREIALSMGYKEVKDEPKRDNHPRDEEP